MTTKKKVLIGSLVGIIIGWIVSNIKNFGICFPIYANYGLSNCTSATQDDITIAIELIALPLFIGTLFLFFVRDDVFFSWFKFARIWLPLSVLIIMLSSSTNGGFLSLNDRSILLPFLFIVFLIVSVILIIYVFIKSNKKHSQNSQIK